MFEKSAKTQYKVGFEISQLEQLIKELPFKIIDIVSESEEEFHLIDFKVIKDPNILMQSIRDYYYIGKYMKSRTKYSEAFADRLTSLINLLKNAKKIIKDLLEIQKAVIFYSPLFALKVAHFIKNFMIFLIKFKKGMENFLDKENFVTYHKIFENEQKILTDLSSVFFAFFSFFCNNLNFFR